ncbi:MAG: outer membrane beta-barrel protein [Aequorivita sp.]
MNIKLLLAIILLSTTSIIAQTDYEAGYIIKTNGQRIDCLIKNEDWKGSPNTFNYKLDENGEIKTGNVSNIKEFGSGENFKYIVATLPVEQSSDKVGDLTVDRNPIFKEETRFLKILVEGNATLYYMLKNNDNRFFYKLNDGDIEQLIYKRYITNNKRIGENNRYKQQLATDIVCSTQQNTNLDKLAYKLKSLTNQFKKYNDCLDSEAVVYEKNDFKYGFNLSIRPGVTFGSASIQKSGEERIDFDSKTGFRIGLEAEYIFPFHNGKWAIFMEPTYRNYTAEKEKSINNDFPTMQNTSQITVEYNSIEIPVGARFYMFLNKDAAIFLNAAVLFDVSTLDSSISSTNSSAYNLDFKTDATSAFGAGFKFKNKYSLEARYHASRNIINYNTASASFQSFSLIAGYNFL